MVINKQNNQQLFFYAVLLVVSTLPFGIKPNSYCLIFLTVVWIIGLRSVNSFEKGNVFILFLIFISFYLLFLIGHLYSADKRYSLGELETKGPLLLFPLIFYSRPRFTAQQGIAILMTFVCATFVSCVFCIAYILLHKNILFGGISSLQPWDFINRNFTQGTGIHPLYLSCYINFSLVILLYYQTTVVVRNKIKPSLIIITALLTGFNFLASSRMGLLFMGIILIYFGFFIAQRKKLYKTAILFFIVPFVLFFSLYFFNRTFRLRMNAAFSNESVEGSLNQRLDIWHSAFSLYKKNWIAGVGTGDVKVELEKEFSLNGYTGPYYNCHNEYLQTGNAIGIFGIVVLSASFLLPFYFGRTNVMYCFFLISLLVYFTTESMLSVQKGVVFYSFFNALFVFGIRFDQENSG